MTYYVPIFERIHIFFLLDRSGSMAGARIITLNEAMTDLLPALSDFGQKEEIQVLMHILAFDHEVQWLCGTTAATGVPVQDIQWTDITCGSINDTAAAIRAIIPGLRPDWLDTPYRPVIVLVTDGCNEDPHDMLESVKELIARARTIRVGIGMGGYNAAELDAFASPANFYKEDELGNLSECECRPLVIPVDDTTDLVNRLKNVVLCMLETSFYSELGPENGNPENNEVINVIKTTTPDDNGESVISADRTDWLFRCDLLPKRNILDDDCEESCFENEAEQSEGTHNEEQEEDSDSSDSEYYPFLT